MNKNLTEIVVVLDRSGSMSSCRADAIGGLNSFIEEQKKVDGQARFTLVQFDDQYEIVYDGVNLKTVGECNLNPRGGTALLDAIGKTIVTTGERLAKMKEKDRPGLVLFVIITDGGENASKEYRDRSKIREMVEHQTNIYNWKFTYLGSNQDGFLQGSSMGFDSAATYNSAAPAAAFKATSGKFSRMRGMASMGLDVDNSYTNEELRSLS